MIICAVERHAFGFSAQSNSSTHRSLIQSHRHPFFLCLAPLLSCYGVSVTMVTTWADDALAIRVSCLVTVSICTHDGYPRGIYVVHDEYLNNLLQFTYDWYIRLVMVLIMWPFDTIFSHDKSVNCLVQYYSDVFYLIYLTASFKARTRRLKHDATRWQEHGLFPLACIFALTRIVSGICGASYCLVIYRTVYAS